MLDLPDLILFVPELRQEVDRLALDGDDLGPQPDGAAKGRGGQVSDSQLDPDCRLACFQVRFDQVAAGALDEKNHRRGGIDTQRAAADVRRRPFGCHFLRGFPRLADVKIGPRHRAPSL